MPSASRWSASLSRSIRCIKTNNAKSLVSSRRCQYSSSIPEPPKRIKTDGNRLQRKRPKKRWELEDHLIEPARTGSPAKGRIIKDDDSDLIDTHSLLNTLLAHQKANATRVRIRAVPGRGSQDGGATVENVKRALLGDRAPVDTKAMHVKLEPQQFLERGDYEGEVRPLGYDWAIINDIPRYLRLPWMRELDLQKPSRESAINRLTTEIQALNRFFSPTRDEVVAAEAALDDIRKMISKHFDDVQRVDVIGSRASGLATALSDLDLNLVPTQPPNATTSEQAVDDSLLARIWKKMRFGLPADSPVTTVYFARYARIPIIVGLHNPTGLEFQIQVADSAYGSLALVKAFMAEWPTLQALFVVFKQCLQMRRLSKGGAGGLTSYPLLNMIVVSLKHHQMHTDRYDVGKQFLQFLDFWSEMDFYTTGITHHPSRYLAMRLTEHEDGNPLSASNAVSLITQDPVAAIPVEFDKRKNLADIHVGRNNFRLTLHDPANPYNDLGRSAYLIKHIQATLLSIRQKVKEDMNEWDTIMQKNGEADKQPVALLRSLIEGDYSIYNLYRRRLMASEREAYDRVTP